MNTQFSEHDDEIQAPVEPTTKIDETLAAPTSAGEASSSLEHADDTTPVARKKRAPRTSTGGAGQARRKRTREDGIIELHVPARVAESAKPLIDTAVVRDQDDEARDELVSQGFTTDEAARIVDLSARLGSSREARDAEASLRRLRFSRWLVERGVLNEFSA